MIGPSPVARLISRHESLAYPYRCQFGDATLEVTEGVFCPTLSNASQLLLEAMEFERGSPRFLDIFAGCGAFGINAALRGFNVVMVDKSENAVLCARRNAKLNGVSERVTALCGEMFSCLSGEDRFDLVAANPPLLAGNPQSALEHALFSPGFDAVVDFVLGIGKHLQPQHGRCYLVTSSVMDTAGVSIDALCNLAGLRRNRCRTRDCGYETYRVDVLSLDLHA